MAANELIQLIVKEWQRLDDSIPLRFGDDADFSLRFNDGNGRLEILAGASVIAHITTAGNLVASGTLTAGSGANVLTNAAGLIDPAKLQQASATTGQALVWGGSAWAPGSIAAALADLTDVDITSAGDGNILVYNVADGEWVNVPISGHATIDEAGEIVVQTMEGATTEADGVEGLVPLPTAGSLDRFLCVDGTFKAPSIGAVTGPGTSTDNAITRWDGTNGDTVQNSLATISDTGNITTPGTLTVGSAAHVLTNSAGLIDGAKIQALTVTDTPLSNTGVTAGTYTVPTITVSAKGRITAAANGSVSFSSLTDVPEYDDNAGKVMIVNSGEDALEAGPVVSSAAAATAIPVSDEGGELDPDYLPELVGDSGAGGVKGVAPAPGTGDAAAGKFLKADGSWAVPEGSGNVAGPGTSTDNALPRFDGVGGQTLQNSGVVVDDSNNITIPGAITAGSGSNAITNSAGLIDGAKVQSATIPLSAISESGATDGQVPIWDDSEGEWVPGDQTGGGGGSSTFLGLTDTPSTFDGASRAFVKVNSAGNALEFVQGGGSAAPDTLCTFTPRDAGYPDTNYATLDTRNNHAVLDFDAATDETIYFTGVLPIRYAGGGVTVEVHYAMTSATSGSVVLDVAWENLADEAQDLDADGFAAAQSVTQTVSDTSGKVKRAVIAFTDGAQMDSVAAGDTFRLLIRRDADNASDNATGDLELVAVHIKETP